MLDRHEPDKQFVDRLEWQIAGEARRRNRAAAGVHPLWRLARVATVVVGSMAFGAAAMGASYQIEESWRKELLVSSLEIRTNLARQRVGLLGEELQRVEQQHAIGVVGDETRDAVRLQIAEAENRVRTLELQLEEVEISGREPSDDISAPLVGGRDFVSDRMTLWKELLDRHVALAIDDVERTRRRVGAGVESRKTLQSMEVSLRELMGQRSAIESDLLLRKRVVDGEVAPAEAELLQLQQGAAQRVAALQLRVGAVAAEVAETRARMAAGTVDSATLRQAELSLAETEGQLELAQREITIVERELAALRGRQ